MQTISRRKFLCFLAAAGVPVSAITNGCDSTSQENRLALHNRSHPLDSIGRENITVADVKVTLLSYETPPEKQWIPSWIPPNSVWWKTDCILVEVFTDQGIVGIGGSSRYGGGIEDTKLYIETVIKPLIAGKNPYDMELLAYTGPDSARRVAWAGVVAAFWDIIGKAKNLPVYKLLATDNEPTTHIRTYASSGEVYEGSVWPDDLIEEALRHKSNGYTAFKFRPGIYWESSGMTVSKYITYMEKLRSAVGPDFDLIQEVNSIWSLEQALEIAPALEELKFLWVEAPVSSYGQDAMDNHLKITEALPTVMVSGAEKELDRNLIMDWIDHGALDLIQPDASIAGLTECWYISRMANIRNIPVCPHNYQGGLTTMENAHLAAGIPNLLMMEMCECFDPLKEEIFREPLVVRDGYLDLPDKPGFGVEIIDNVAQKFPYIPGHYERRRG